MKPGQTSRRAALLAFVLGATILAFLPVLKNGWVGSWDDGMFLLDNPHYRGFDPQRLRWMFFSFIGGHCQPLTWLTFACDFMLWGMRPAGYHLTSMLLHACNAGLFFLVARRLLAAARPGAVDGPAALAALLFSLHPLRVEAVAWASDRRDVLAGFFYLAALLAYLRGKDRGARRASFLAAACAAFACSLLSKAIGLTLPLVLLVIDRYPLRRPLALAEKIPFFLLALAAAVLGATAQASLDTLRPLRSYGPLERLSQAAYGMSFYLEKTVFPLGLSPLYEVPARWDPFAPAFLCCAVLVCLISALAWRLRREFPALAAAWLCYAATLAPVLGLVLTGYQLVADRYSYLSCLSWPLLACVPLASRRLRPLAAVLLLFLTAQTWRQARFWRNDASLWTRVLGVSPDSVIAHSNLGSVLASQGLLREAVAHFARAVELDPVCVEAQDRLVALDNAAADAAEIARLRETLKVNPACRNARENLVTARAALGEDLPGAVIYYRQLLALGLRKPGLYANLGRALRAQGLNKQAEEAFRLEGTSR